MSIKASRCNQCGRVVVPPREICPYCRSNGSDVVTVDLSPEGTIESYTLLHMPPQGFDAPLLLALVKLEGGASVLCVGDTGISSSIEVGTPVSVEVDKSQRFRFRPV